MPSSVSFHLKDQVSLGFEEGLWAFLPWTETKTMRGEVLDKLLIKFVFSGGVIHSVSSEPMSKANSVRNNRERMEVASDPV